MQPFGVHGDEHRPALREVAEVRRVQAVDVLRRIERADHGVAVEVRGQRQLHEDAVDDRDRR